MAPPSGGTVACRSSRARALKRRGGENVQGESSYGLAGRDGKARTCGSKVGLTTSAAVARQLPIRTGTARGVAARATSDDVLTALTMFEPPIGEEVGWRYTFRRAVSWRHAQADSLDRLEWRCADGIEDDGGDSDWNVGVTLA